MKIKQAAFAFLFCVFVVAGNVLAQVVPQRMQLRPSGFVGPDSVTNYIVINVPKVSKADLYSRALTYINGLYSNPQGVVTTVPGASITVNASTDALKSEYLKTARYPMKYNLTIEVKDGKIKFTPVVVSIKQYLTEDADPQTIYINKKDSPRSNEPNCIWSMYNSGAPMLVEPSLKSTADAWINNYIAGLVAKVNENW